MRIYISIVILAIFTCSALSQNTEVPSMRESLYIQPNLSPEAAAFDRYGQIPIGHTSGTAHISIPLYTVESGDISIPISLSYHSSGVKVDDIATWIGLGWSLNAGAVITRKVNDIPDHHGTHISNQKGENVFNNMTNETSLIRTLRYEKSRRIDQEYDTYNLNLFGETYSFYVENQGNLGLDSSGSFHKCVLLKNETITIRLENSDNIYKAGSFEVSKDGYLYIFEKKEIAYNEFQIKDRVGTLYNTTYSAGSPIEIPVPVTWHLTTIISPSNKKIHFEYSRVDPVDNFYTIQEIMQYGELKSKISCEELSGVYHQDTENRIILGVSKYYVQYYLSKIKFDGGEVIFNSTLGRKDLPKGRSLKSIQIKQGTNTIIKQIDLEQKYIQADTQYRSVFSKEEDKYRLVLNKLKVGSKEYSFEYNETLLPPRFSYAKDWEGYFNGKKNASLLPEIVVPSPAKVVTNHYYTLGYYSVSREPDSEKMQAGILTKIIYPTKGYTKFEYTNHKAKNYAFSNSVNDIGGLKIKTIKSYDQDHRFIEGKMYDFQAGNIYQMEVPEVSRHFASDLRKKNTIQKGRYKGAYCYRKLPAGGSYPILVPIRGGWGTYSSEKFGSPYDHNINYTHIREYNIDSYGVYDGYIDYEYSYQPDLVYAPDNSAAQFINRSYLRGNLINSKVYKYIEKKGSVLIKKVEYEYKEKIAHTNYNLCLTQDFDIYEGDSDDREAIKLFENEHYFWLPLHSVFYNVRSIKETIYDENNIPMLKQTNYEYNTINNKNYNNNKLARKTINNTKDQKIETIYTYNATKAPIGTFGHSFPLIQKIEKSDGDIIFDQKITYDSSNSSIPKQIRTRFDGTADYQLQEEVLEYDQYWNPIYMKLKDGTGIVQIWSNYGQYLVANIVNSSYEEVKSALGTSYDIKKFYNNSNALPTAYVNALNSLRNKLPKAFITTYTYQPMVGLLSQTDPSGIKTSYTYDTWGRLKTIWDTEDIMIKDYIYYYTK